MSLSLQSQRFGGIVLAKCGGRIVEGSESSLLQQEVDGLLDESPYVVLDLSDIDFIDSSGLGLLVRLLNRARPARRGSQNLRSASSCQGDPQGNQTRNDSPAVRIRGNSDCGDVQPCEIDPHAGSTATDNLCVAESRDVLAYVCEILRQAGFGVLSSDNLPDALMLLRAVRPKAVVIDSDLRAARATSTAESFNTLADAHCVIELSADFSHRDAGEAGERLLDRVRSLIG